MTNRLLFSLILTTLLFSCLSHRECVHDKLDQDIKIAGPEYQIYEQPEGRVLQQYNNINILIDYSAFTGASAAIQNYIQNSIMPPVMNYLQATISVPTRSTKLKAGGYSTLCSGTIAVSSKYNLVGVNYDLVVFVQAKNDTSASYVAAGSACLLDPTTNRPTFGQITFNLANIDLGTSDADRESDITTTMHELTHVLGFSASLFPYYINPSTGASLKGHYTSKTVMGYATTILNLPTLTSLIQSHFNCSSIPGAYMENQGGPGSAGSHFERRVFYNEYMTASTIVDTRVSKFTLALLEGTGWYKVDYTKAETTTWGQNKGCSFYTGSCVNTATKQANFDEFCTTLVSKGCSWTNRAGGSCGAFQLTTSSKLPAAINWWGNNTLSQDSFSDNCPLIIPYTNLDCENTNNAAAATISTESFGYGSKCFMGTLFPQGKLTTPFPYCFKSTCQNDDEGNYFVQLSIGTTVVNCTSEGSIKVAGYGGVLNCPDPNTFCYQNMVEGNCRRSCSARGTCIKNQCACVEGWSGYDCSQQNYLDSCARCTNGDPFRTTCYGDSCVCNPSNTTCMCGLGLLTGSACQPENGSVNIITNDTATGEDSLNITISDGSSTNSSTVENDSLNITTTDTYEGNSTTENGVLNLTTTDTYDGNSTTENDSLNITTTDTYDGNTTTENGVLNLTTTDTYDGNNTIENSSLNITTNDTATGEDGLNITISDGSSTNNSTVENDSLNITTTDTYDGNSTTENGVLNLTTTDTYDGNSTTDNGSLNLTITESTSNNTSPIENGGLNITTNDTATGEDGLNVTISDGSTTNTSTVENGGLNITTNDTATGEDGLNITVADDVGQNSPSSSLNSSSVIGLGSINSGSGETEGTGSVSTTNNNSSKKLILAISLGVGGAVLVLIVLFFIIRRIKALKRLNQSEAVPGKLYLRKPTLTIPKNAMVMEENTTNQSQHSPNSNNSNNSNNSSPLNRKNLSARSLGDSPLITHQNSPLKKNYAQSRFRLYSPERDRYSIDKDNNDSPNSAGLCIKPIDLAVPEPKNPQQEQEHDQEDPVMRLEDVLNDLESPELRKGEFDKEDEVVDRKEGVKLNN